MLEQRILQTLDIKYTPALEVILDQVMSSMGISRQISQAGMSLEDQAHTMLPDKHLNLPKTDLKHDKLPVVDFSWLQGSRMR